MPWVVAGLAVALVLFHVFGARASAKPPLVGPGARILLLGDSLAVGLSRRLGQLADAAKVPLATNAKVGTSVPYWRGAHTDEALAAATPTLVLVSLGTNDVAPGTQPLDCASFVAVATQIQKAHASVVWIAPPTLPFDRRNVDACIAEATTRVFPSDHLVIPRGGDHLHPTQAGYDDWADKVWMWLTT